MNEMEVNVMSLGREDGRAGDEGGAELLNMRGKKKKTHPVVLPHADARVGRAKVDAHRFSVNASHDCLLSLLFELWEGNKGGIDDVD